MKRSILFVVLLSLAAAIAAAATRPLYRISLRDGNSVMSTDRPIHRGSILLFHVYPKGALTGLPEELVAGVMPAVQASVDELTVNAAPVLEPGEVVFLPPLAGDRSTTAPSAQTPSAAPPIPGGVYDPRNPAYGYAPQRMGGAAGAQTLLPSGAIAPGDLARAISAPPPTTEVPFGSNGFPVTPGTSTLAIGPDGLPILIQAGAPGSTPPPIGPNGTPVMAPVGAPGSTPPSIGPNGTPVLAPSGMPGSVPPPVGPNGFPAPRGPGG